MALGRTASRSAAQQRPGSAALAHRTAGPTGSTGNKVVA
jgi:hypothetical protein